MLREQKRNVDTKGLSSFMRNGLIAIGLIIILGYYRIEPLHFSGIANSMIIISGIGGITFPVMK